MAFIFGAFWLLLLAPLGWRRVRLWLLFLIGAVLFVPAIALVQLPIQRALSQFIVALVGIETYQEDILVLSVPAVLVSGLVQEAAKLLPVFVFWEMRKRAWLPKFGLSVGAIVGAGFGVFEAQWLLNSIFAAGFTLGWVSTFGLEALGGFWERFFSIAFHVGSGALLGWGVARRRAWLFFLLTTILHVLLNYTVILFQTGILTAIQVEFAIAIVADITFFIAFMLRWRDFPMEKLEKYLPPEQIAPTEATISSVVPDNSIVTTDELAVSQSITRAVPAEGEAPPETATEGHFHRPVTEMPDTNPDTPPSGNTEDPPQATESSEDKPKSSDSY